MCIPIIRNIVYQIVGLIYKITQMWTEPELIKQGYIPITYTKSVCSKTYT